MDLVRLATNRTSRPQLDHWRLARDFKSKPGALQSV